MENRRGGQQGGGPSDFPELVADHLKRIRSAAAELELECDYFARQVLPSGTRDATPIVSAEAPCAPECASELPIPAGRAGLTVVAAMANLVAAVCAVERVAMALARAADVTTRKAPTEKQVEDESRGIDELRRAGTCRSELK